MPAWSRRRIALAVTAAVMLLLVVGGVLALPVVVRHVAVAELSARTGRAVALDRVELSLLTGRVTLRGFRLAQRDSTEPAVQIERLDLRVALFSLFGEHIRLVDLTVTRPKLYVTRLTPDQYDFSDLLALIPPPAPNQKPSTTTVTVERLRVVSGSLVARDQVPQPAGVWRIDGLDVDATGIGTRRDAPPGRLAVRALVNDTKLALEASSVEVAAGRVAARVTLDGFDLAAARAYLPPDLPAAPVAGKVTLDLTVAAERAADGTPSVRVAGDARVDGLSVVQRAQPDAFLTIGRVAVKIKDARPLARDVALAAVEIDGLDLRARRDRAGRIDLLGLAAPAPAAAAPAAAAASQAAPAPQLKISVDRVVLRGAAALTDDTVRPAARLGVRDIAINLEHLTWPGPAPVALDVALGLPGAGNLSVKGTATLEPFSVDVVSSLRGGSIAPYQPYIPLRARIAGSFNGDSRTRVSMAGGTLTATSQGRSWIDNLEIRRPDGGAPPMRVARMAMAGIDFGWPTHARVAAITITKPAVEVERDASGTLTLRELFVPGEPESQPSAAPKATDTPPPAEAPKAASKPKTPISDDPRGGAVGFPVDIAVFVIDDAYVRFLDRSVQPAFSETLSRFAVKVEGLSTTPGRRAKLTSQAIVGGDAALDVHGELAPLGELYVDLEGELRDFKLAQVNPYATSAIAWIIDRGKLGVKFRFHVERDQLEASNEIVVQDLHVQPTPKEDEVKKRIGLPLGMIVALITDGDNGLRVNLPMSGSVSAWKTDLSDAIWAVVKNAAVNIVAAPFRAIGRLFTGTNNTIESVGVNPVTFAAGSDVVTPEMARHLTSVADFLRRAPGVRLTLASVPSAGDVESLRAQELTARLQQRQREKGLPDFAAAAAAEFGERFPGVKPPPPDEQLTRLRAEESLPDERMADLLARRAGVVRDGLVRAEGVPEARLLPAEGAAPAPGDGEGRVEFRVGQ